MTDNKIWHSKHEVPDDCGKYVIVKYIGFTQMYSHSIGRDWVKLIKDNDVIEWCYFDDLADRAEKLEQENISLKLSLEPCPGCGMRNCDCVCQEIRMANDRQYEQEPTREMLMDGGIIDSHGNPY